MYRKSAHDSVMTTVEHFDLPLSNSRLPAQTNLLSMVNQTNRSALTTTIRGYTGSTLSQLDQLLAIGTSA